MANKKGMMDRNNNFDFLRFLAATFVILSHSYPLTTGDNSSEILYRSTFGQMTLGGLGVDIFFIISGYLITQSYDRRSNFFGFVKARILRIIPALICVVFLSAFVLGPFLTDMPLREYFSNKQTFLYLCNIFLISTYFVLPGVLIKNIYPNGINGSLWTIPYEVKCYIIVAFLGITKLLKSKAIIILLFCGTTILSILSPSILKSFVPEIFLTFITLFKYFCVGMLFYCFRENVPKNKYLATGSAILLLISMYAKQLEIFFPFFGGYLILYFAFNQRIKLYNFGKYGDFSYGLYIYAFPVQQLIVYLFGGKMNHWLNFVISFPVTLVLAILSWNIIEKKALALKNKSFFNFLEVKKLYAKMLVNFKKEI